MNTLTLTFEPFAPFEPSQPTNPNPQWIPVWVRAAVDDNPLPDTLDADDFFRSLTEDGRLPLFTCGCGVFGCGGYYVDVSHPSDRITWRNRYAPNGLESANSAALLEACEYTFARSHMRDVAAGLLSQLQAFQQEYPSADVQIAYGGSTLSGRLDWYAAQVQALAE